MAKIDCKYLHERILQTVRNLPKRGKLCIISVGNNPASEAYMKGKLKDAEYCGVDAEVIRYPEDISQNELLMKIAKLNWSPEVGGIIVQLPLPKHLNEDEIVQSVAPVKDVDGFVHNSPFKPCTPEAIVWLMEQELGDLCGKSVLLIGRGKLVGKPLIQILLDKDCTVTVAHSKTVNIKEICEQYHDCIITGVGRPEAFNMMFAQTRLLIDAGISKVDGHLKGDCCGCELGEFDYTPVPNGVGLLTRAFLMRHMVNE